MSELTGRLFLMNAYDEKSLTTNTVLVIEYVECFAERKLRGYSTFTSAQKMTRDVSFQMPLRVKNPFVSKKPFRVHQIVLFPPFPFRPPPRVPRLRNAVLEYYFLKVGKPKRERDGKVCILIKVVTSFILRVNKVLFFIFLLQIASGAARPIFSSTLFPETRSRATHVHA